MAIAKVEPGKTRLGWIGTGVMGGSMCGHLLAAGFEITVYSRTRTKAQPLLDRGAHWADSPGAVAENADVVFSIVGFPADVREVVLGDHGVLAGCEPGNILVDMTTSQPSLAIEIAERAQGSGRSRHRRPGLRRRCGGPEGDVVDHDRRRRGDRSTALAPCFEAMGKSLGAPGWSRSRTAHEDGQSDPDRLGHDRRLRSVALRLPGGPRSADRPRIGRQRRGWKLVAIESRPENHRGQLRPRLLRRALHQRHGNCPR